MNFEELKATLKYLLLVAENEDSTLFIYIRYAEVYFTIFQYCLENTIIIDGYDIRSMEKIDGKRSVFHTFIDKLTFFYYQVASEYENGTLTASEEFINIMEYVRDIGGSYVYTQYNP